MRYQVLALALLLTLPVWAADIEDDFSTDTIGNYTQEFSDYSISGGVLASANTTQHDVLQHDTALGGSDMWGCVQASSGVFFGNNYYYVRGEIGGNSCQWRIALSSNRLGTSVGSTTFTANTVANDYICARVTGTSTSTDMKMWRFDSASPPADYTTDAAWNSAAEESCGWTNCGATCVDSNTKVGIYSNDGAGSMNLDNFKAGCIGCAASIEGVVFDSGSRYE